jgi:hypothetical protein
MYNMESVRMRVTHLRISFHIPNPSGSLVIIIRLEANCRFHVQFLRDKNSTSTADWKSVCQQLWTKLNTPKQPTTTKDMSGSYGAAGTSRQELTGKMTVLGNKRGDVSTRCNTVHDILATSKPRTLLQPHWTSGVFVSKPNSLCFLIIVDFACHTLL